MLNRTMQMNHPVSLTLSSASVLSTFAFNAVRFFSALRFYFYYFFMRTIFSERQLVS